MTELDKPVAQLLGAYASAVLAADAQAFMRLYDPKARVFDAWGVWLYEDAASWQRAVEGWLSSLGTQKVKVSFDEVHTSGTKDFMVLNAIVTYASFSAQGEALRAMQNRLTWALRTSGHALRIVHEHTSAPVGFEDQKAILTRDTSK